MQVQICCTCVDLCQSIRDLNLAVHWLFYTFSLRRREEYNQRVPAAAVWSATNLCFQSDRLRSEI